MKKSRENDRYRLFHMLYAARQAVSFLSGITRADFEHDEMRQCAVAWSIAVLGEAANYVTDEFQTEHAQIEWSDITGMRHRLIHGYFQIDRDVVWAAVKDEIPLLVAELEMILELA